MACGNRFDKEVVSCHRIIDRELEGSPPTTVEYGMGIKKSVEVFRSATGSVSRRTPGIFEGVVELVEEFENQFSLALGQFS